MTTVDDLPTPRPPLRLLAGLAGFAVLLALGVVVGVAALTRPAERLPWATFPDAIGYVGDLDERASIVSRQVDAGGTPVITSTTIETAHVRCGPPRDTAIVTYRTWLVRIPGGHVETFGDDPQGFVVPASGCGTFAVGVTIPADVAAYAERHPDSKVALQLLTDDPGDTWRPVPLRTEWVRYDPAGVIPTTADTVQLAIPDA